MRNRTLVFSVAAALAGFGVVAQEAGPPPFVSYPILLHVAEAAMDHGHFAFGPGESVTPAPLAPTLGATAFQSALTTAPLVGTGSDGNVSASPDSYEGETGAASNGALLVGASNHIYPGSCSATAASGTFGDCAPLAYASSNATSWSKTALPRNWNNTQFGIGFDPAVDYDKNGVFYASYGVAPLSGSYPNAIVVVKSTNGTAWTKLTPVTFNTSKNFDDKYYMAIDRSNSAFANRIYISWDRNSSNNQTLYTAYSSDGGATWSAPIKVNDGSRTQRVIGAYPAVNQNNGVVYVSWHDYAKNIIYVDKSGNGGVSWGVDVAAAATHAGFGADIGCVGGRSQGPAHALKVGPSGALYLVYADPVTNRGFDVLFTKSTDGGATWSAPISLNDDATANDQFHPTLSVQAGAGGDDITVTFYDRRDDATNCSAHVYATRSVDSGVSWSTNVRQTSAASNFNGNANGPGDYSSSSPFGAAVYPFFSDHRTSNPETASGGAFDVYTVNVQ